MHILIRIFNIEPGPQTPVITLDARFSRPRKGNLRPLVTFYTWTPWQSGITFLIAQGMQPSAHCAGADTGISGPFVEIRGFAAAWQLHQGYQ